MGSLAEPAELPLNLFLNQFTVVAASDPVPSVAGVAVAT
jgi:hypothetical protein